MIPRSLGSPFVLRTRVRQVPLDAPRMSLDGLGTLLRRFDSPRTVRRHGPPSPQNATTALWGGLRLAVEMGGIEPPSNENSVHDLQA